jgi:hypothetical protein
MSRTTTSRPSTASCPCKKLPYSLSSFTAAEHGNVHSLFRHGTAAIVNRQDEATGTTPLHLAAQHGHVAATAALLAAGCNVNGIVSVDRFESDPNDNDGNKRQRKRATPLHRASFSGAVATMQLLLQDTVCHVMARDFSFGDLRTPLHKAAAGGRPLAVQLLIETLRSRGLLEEALLCVDSCGLTPLQVAVATTTSSQNDNDNSSLQQQRQSVARWDSVAGSHADWKACVQLLQNAEATTTITTPTTTTTTQQQHPEVTAAPPIPKHLTKAAATPNTNCLDDDCGGGNGSNGICLTASWERSFWSALSQQASHVLQEKSSSSLVRQQNSNPPISSSSSLVAADLRGLQNKKEAQQSSPAVVTVQNHDTAPTVASTIMTMSSSLPETTTTSKLLPIAAAAADVVMVGTLCDQCGKRTIAVYPITIQDGQKRQRVCKKCYKQKRNKSI